MINRAEFFLHYTQDLALRSALAPTLTGPSSGPFFNSVPTVPSWSKLTKVQFSSRIEDT